MSKLLMDDNPVVVSPKLATVLGLEAAVFMQQVHYWVNKNRGESVYNTIAQWHEQLPFMSVRSIERMIKNLKEKGVLTVTLVANSGNSFVKTNYYNINYDALDLMCELHDHANACPETAKMADGDRQNGGTETAKMAEHYITETTTETTQRVNARTAPHTPVSEKPIDLLIAEGVDAQVADDFLKVRIAKKSPLTRTALAGIASEAKKAGLTVAQAVQISAQNGWAGFKASWQWRDDCASPAAKPQSRHTGLNEKDYTAGIDANGRLM